MYDMADLLTLEVDASSFEPLIPIPSEVVGAACPFFSSSTVQPVAAIEIPDIVWLVNEAFQSLSVYNLDLRKMYDQVFNLLHLPRRFGLWGRVREIAISRSASSELEVVIEQLDSLQDVSRLIIGYFSNVSKSTDGIRLTVRKALSLWMSSRFGQARGSASCVQRGICWCWVGHRASYCLEGEGITRDMAQVVTLEAELEKVWATMEEQLNTLTKDFL